MEYQNLKSGALESDIYVEFKNHEAGTTQTVILDFVKMLGLKCCDMFQNRLKGGSNENREYDR